MEHQQNFIKPSLTAQKKGSYSQERFRLLVESVKDYAIFLLDEEGFVSSWNEGAQRNKGYTADEIIGRHFSTFYTPEDIARAHPQAELEIAKRDGRYEEEGWRVRKDGSRFWANIVLTALRDETGKHVGFAKVTRDLTERKVAEEKLKRALENMERSVEERTRELSESNRKLKEAVQIRDDFLSIASHELRTPLTPLKLQIQGLVRQIKNKTLFDLPEDRALRMAQTCERGITKLSTLIENLLDVSRLNSGKFQLAIEEVDFAALVREVIERYKSDIVGSGSALTVHIPESVIGTFDRMRMEQVVTNLLNNAIKYGVGNPIEILLSTGKNVVHVCFSDNGVGISKEDQNRIFERFERADTDDSRGGLGLGLYITRQIVQAHGGKISVESELGQGSTFTVELSLRLSQNKE